MKIRKAQESEAGILSDLSLVSKKHWKYPPAYFEIWAEELQISRDYIRDNDVWVYQEEGVVVAYCSMVCLKEDVTFKNTVLNKGYWLEHMFVLPEYIGRSIGRQLFNHVAATCIKRYVPGFSILADPHARGFYELMGCEYRGDVPSSIPGRTTPLLTCSLSGGDSGI